MDDVRPVCLMSDVTLSWMHLDADPDLDASTNRAFRDVRDVGPNIFGRSVRSDASSYGYSAW